MTPDEQIAAGQQAKAALRLLDEAFEVVSAQYLARLQDIASTEPWAVDKLRSLALAQKIAIGVKAHIEAIAAGASVAEANREHRQKIERMSPERRRILGLAVGN